MGKGRITIPEGIALTCGVRLAPLTVAYETYGRLNTAGDNAVLVPHALTGDAHLARHGEDDPRPGWWEPLIGPGRLLDPERYFIIGTNVLGGCYGTTGPASLNPATGKPYGLSFPIITIRDQVRVQHALLAALGVKRLIAVIGGSMGGMQVLEWGTTYPEEVEKLIPIATCGRTTAQQIAWNEIGRLAIMNDPAWRGGDYYGTEGPARGLALARMVGIVTYKSEADFAAKFGRDFAGVLPSKLARLGTVAKVASDGAGEEVRARPDVDYFSWAGGFQMESYLHYQGEKLVRRFDANSYLYLTKAMDLHDLGYGYPSYNAALARIQSRVLAVGIDSDFLYPPAQLQEIVQLLREQGKEATYREIHSQKGHDAFLIEFTQLTELLRPFLED